MVEKVVLVQDVVLLARQQPLHVGAPAKVAAVPAFPLVNRLDAPGLADKAVDLVGGTREPAASSGRLVRSRTGEAPLPPAIVVFVGVHVVCHRLDLRSILFQH